MCFILTSKAEEFLGVWWEVRGDVHGGRLSGKERVQGRRGGGREGGRGQRRGLIFNMGQLALPRVPNRRLALSLCGVNQKEGLHSWLEHWRNGSSVTAVHPQSRLLQNNSIS